MVSRGRYRRLSLLSAILILSLGFLAFSSHHRRVPAVTSFKERYPLLWKHVHTFKGRGGGKAMHYTSRTFVLVPPLDDFVALCLFVNSL